MVEIKLDCIRSYLEALPKKLLKLLNNRRSVSIQPKNKVREVTDL